jgi:GT2 family glycosyltransferase
MARPSVLGKFIYRGNEKFYVRGVTYGTFRPNEQGCLFPDREQVASDFAQMSENGINSIRTYTPPPEWLLDLALDNNILVMVGLPWEQHVTFLDDKYRARSIVGRVRDAVRLSNRHPAILCYAIGNEIPSSIVRWHGSKRVEEFLFQLFLTVKNEDPAAIVTYVNFPTTEYLDLPFLDLACFNVYLEAQDTFEVYIARLQNLVGDRPLIMAEMGLDSRSHGEEAQATALEWQIRSTFARGCAGAFVFAWTDEWYRGGHDIGDWDFGLTGRDRTPKAALTAVRQAYARVPFPSDLPWPSISVVVCTYNGARTIAQCLDHMMLLDYPRYEVIVVEDGSTDDTAAIVEHYPVRMVRIPNGGLSNARNVGLREALGEIVAYTDDDAYPDPHWLQYLAHSFLTTRHVGVGGPNIPPPEDGPIEQCVANAPGGPIHVLVSDTEAEHIPGCNMSFRRDALLAVNGCDAQFRTAGDDVDLCWRLIERGGTIGFSPAAVVWHHRRNTVKAYLRQQIGYGRAEALLEKKWPEKYNALGHVSWSGRLYGRGLMSPVFVRRSLIYQGRWGTAPFQSIYQRRTGRLDELPQTPEWYLLTLALAGFGIMSFYWKTPSIFSILFAVAITPLITQAILSASNANFPSRYRSAHKRFGLHALTALLYFAQPIARLCGRMKYGLTPWRQRGVPELAFPRPRVVTAWSEAWHSTEELLDKLEGLLKSRGAITLHGGDFDSWDLEVRGGILGAVRTRMAVEEHGSGRQLIRFRSWPSLSVQGLVCLIVLLGTSAYILSYDERTPAVITGAMTLLLAIWMLRECAIAKASVLDALDELNRLSHES